MSHDGRYIANQMGSSSGSLLGAWDVHRRALAWVRLVRQEGIFHGLPPDGRSLVYQTDDRILHFRDVRTGEERRKDVMPRRYDELAFSPRGDAVAANCEAPPTLEAFTYPSWKPKMRASAQPALRLIGFTRDGKRIVASVLNAEGGIAAVEAATGARTRVAGGFHGCAALSADGRFLYGGSDSVRCVDMRTGWTVWERAYLPEGVYGVAAPESGKSIALALKGDLNLLEASTGRVIAHAWAAHAGGISSMLTGGADGALVTAGGDGAVRGWDAGTLREFWSMNVVSVDDARVTWEVVTPESVRHGSTPVVAANPAIRRCAPAQRGAATGPESAEPPRR